MLLPTGLYMIGGGIVVALTFIIAVIFAGRSVEFQGKAISVSGEPIPQNMPRWSGFVLVFLAILIFSGFYGSRDPLDNPLPLMVWKVWWVGMTFLTAIFGDYWKSIHPWHALHALLINLPGLRYNRGQHAFTYPNGLGYWPSVLLFLLFAWIELVHPSPMDPEILATAIVMYVIIVSAGMILFGKESWLKYAEPFCVFFRMVGWLSPLEWRKGRRNSLCSISLVGLRWPCRRLLELPSLPISGVAFVLLVLSTVSFDGLSRTFWWLNLIGENPLEYPGRTVLIYLNTLGMLTTFSIFLVVYALTRIQTLRSKGMKGGLPESGFALSIIPIAFGYHFAHYLPNFLVDIQYAFISFSDPLGMGWNLFGTRDWQVRSSFLTHHDLVVITWYFQVSGIVLAHIAAVVVAHLLTLQTEEKRSRVIFSQIPATLLMIAYTILGLWLLSTPVAA
ncbi:MAG: hypothetical protein VX399_10215 [SAR324 cluster bacterium]|nr:hypothetical protein [SAR324 cluster bacterium]